MARALASRGLPLACRGRWGSSRARLRRANLPTSNTTLRSGSSSWLRASVISASEALGGSRPWCTISPRLSWAGPWVLNKPEWAARGRSSPGLACRISSNNTAATNTGLILWRWDSARIRGRSSTRRPRVWLRRGSNWSMPLVNNWARRGWGPWTPNRSCSSLSSSGENCSGSANCSEPAAELMLPLRPGSSSSRGVFGPLWSGKLATASRAAVRPVKRRNPPSRLPRASQRG